MQGKKKKRKQTKEKTLLEVKRKKCLQKELAGADIVRDVR
jgi:hypothetical protein